MGLPHTPDGPLAQTTVRLVNRRGLHARASAAFVKTAQDFDAHIEVVSHNGCGEETVTADSIMELLMLGSACGEDITIRAQGPEAQVAVASLAALVKDGFGEGE